MAVFNAHPVYIFRSPSSQIVMAQGIDLLMSNPVWFYSWQQRKFTFMVDSNFQPGGFQSTLQTIIQKKKKKKSWMKTFLGWNIENIEQSYSAAQGKRWRIPHATERVHCNFSQAGCNYKSWRLAKPPRLTTLLFQKVSWDSSNDHKLMMLCLKVSTSPLTVAFTII